MNKRNKKNKKKKDRPKETVSCRRIVLVNMIVIVAVMLVSGLWILLARSPSADKQMSGSVSVEESDSAVEEEKSTQSFDSAPNYDFRTDEITVELENLDRTYRIAVVNDLHLITDTHPGDVLEENLTTVMDRYETLSVTPEGIHAKDLWPQVVDFLNYNNFDAVVFAGDMLDYCSHSNMEALRKGFDNLEYSKEQLLYIRSDHDYGGWYGGSTFTDADGFAEQAKLWDEDDGRGCIEFDAFKIVGINKSYQNVSEGRLEFLEKEITGDKPVFVVTHVPFYSMTDDTLAEVSMATRNKIYYWNAEDSAYCPDENTQKLIDLMYAEDSNVKYILSAHIHAAWDGEVREGLREHVFAPTFEGRIGIVNVVPGTGNHQEKVSDKENPKEGEKIREEQGKNQ